VFVVIRAPLCRCERCGFVVEIANLYDYADASTVLKLRADGVVKDAWKN
jgi:hypothetical protein